MDLISISRWVQHIPCGGGFTQTCGGDQGTFQCQVPSKAHRSIRTIQGRLLNIIFSDYHFSIAISPSFNFDLLGQAKKDESYCSNLNKYPKVLTLSRDSAGQGEFLQFGRRHAKTIFQIFQVKTEGFLWQNRGFSSPLFPFSTVWNISWRLEQHHPGGCIYLGQPRSPEFLFPKVILGDDLEKSTSEFGPDQGSASVEIFKISERVRWKMSLKKANHHNSSELQPGKKEKVWRWGIWEKFVGGNMENLGKSNPCLEKAVNA